MWAGLTRMSLSSGIQEGFVRFCFFLTCRYVQSGDSQYDFLPVSVCNPEFRRVKITILFGEWVSKSPNYQELKLFVGTVRTLGWTQ